jgi:hypothetical protein
VLQDLILYPTLMSFYPRLRPRTWLLTYCGLLIVFFLVASIKGKLVLPTQIRQAPQPDAQSGSEAPHHELLDVTSNATLGEGALSW